MHKQLTLPESKSTTEKASNQKASSSDGSSGKKGKCVDCGREKSLTKKGYCLDCVARSMNKGISDLADEINKEMKENLERARNSLYSSTQER